MKKIKTGIYGGSFNPIHNGHIAIARKMIELAGLDEVWLMVSPQNPLKHSVDLLNEQLRLFRQHSGIAKVLLVVAASRRDQYHKQQQQCFDECLFHTLFSLIFV